MENFRKPEFCIIGIILFVLILRFFTMHSFYANVDESVSNVIANTILDGGIVYKDAIDHRGPITYFLYALVFFIFGRNNIFAIHIALLVLILATIIILYKISVLIWNKKVGCWAALLFAVFSYTYIDPDMMALHTEWAAIFFSALGVYFLFLYFYNNKFISLLLSGFCFGLGFFSKQPILADYAVALVFCSLFTYTQKPRRRALLGSLISMVSGFLLTVAIFIYYFYSHHALNDFYFYFWQYNSQYYLSGVSIFNALKYAIHYFFMPHGFFGTNILLVILFVFSSVMAVFKFIQHPRENNTELLVEFYLIFWGISSYLGASYSGRNFGHYFIMILPAFCLLGGHSVYNLFYAIDSSLKPDEVKHKIALPNKYYIKLFCAVVVIVTLSYPLAYYIGLRVATKRSYSIPQDLDAVTEYIQNNTAVNDKIFVWGWYPEIYVLTNRRPASRYTYCNFLTGLIPFTNAAAGVDTSKTIVPGSWEKFTEEMKINQPKYIVDASVGNHYAYGKYPPSKFSALSQLLKEKYILNKEFFAKNGTLSFRVFKRID